MWGREPPLGEPLWVATWHTTSYKHSAELCFIVISLSSTEADSVAPFFFFFSFFFILINTFTKYKIYCHLFWNIRIFFFFFFFSVCVLCLISFFFHPPHTVHKPQLGSSRPAKESSALGMQSGRSQLHSPMLVWVSPTTVCSRLGVQREKYTASFASPKERLLGKGL